MQKQLVYSYNFDFYDYPNMQTYDRAVSNGTVKDPYGTIENMTFTTGATSKHRYKVEGGTNISQGDRDKTYRIQRGGGQYAVRINDMDGKDHMTVPGKRTVGNVRIHSVTAKSIGCITSFDTKYKLQQIGKKYPHFNEKDFSDDFRDLESQGHGKTYIRVPADPEYDNISHLYSKGTIKSKSKNNQPFGLQEPIQYNEVIAPQQNNGQDGQAPTNNESFIPSSEPQVAISHNGNFSSATSNTNNIDYRTLSPYSTFYEVDDTIKKMNESKDNEIPMAQTYDMNGNPT